MRDVSGSWVAFATRVADVVAVRRLLLAALDKEGQEIHYAAGVRPEDPPAHLLFQGDFAFDVRDVGAVFDQLSVIRVYDYFVTFLSEMAEKILELRPVLRSKVRVNLEGARVFEAADLQTLRSEVVAQRVDSVRRTGAVRLLRFLCSGLDIKLDANLEDRMNQDRELRNVLVHAGGDVARAGGLRRLDPQPIRVDFDRVRANCLEAANLVDSVAVARFPSLVGRVYDDEEYVDYTFWQQFDVSPDI